MPNATITIKIDASAAQNLKVTAFILASTAHKLEGNSERAIKSLPFGF
jgi:hypothetical protein